MAPICTSGPSKQGDEVQNGPVLHLRAGNSRGAGAKSRFFAPLRAEDSDLSHQTRRATTATAYFWWLPNDLSV